MTSFTDVEQTPYSAPDVPELVTVALTDQDELDMCAKGFAASIWKSPIRDDGKPQIELVPRNQAAAMIAMEQGNFKDMEDSKNYWKGCAHKAETELDQIKALLKDRNAVHIAMLRGDIANPTAEQINHIYAAPDAVAAALPELQELLGRLDAGLEYEGSLETENDHVELFNIDAAQELFFDAANTIRTLSAEPAHGEQLPQDVINLVIAARELVYNGNIIVGEYREEAEALDKAIEVFSERVPYDDQPYQYETEVTPSSGCVFSDMGVDRPASGGWQPIETAPDDKLILLSCADWPLIEESDGIPVKVGGYWDGKWNIFGGSWHPTHWMPLPPAPETDHGR